MLSVDGQVYVDVNGRRITPDGTLQDFGQPDLIIIPDLHLDPNGALPEEFAQLIPWLLKAHSDGALIASVCSGALLLAATGLLNGLDATSHWGFCDVIARQFPEIKMRRENQM